MPVYRVNRVGKTGYIDSSDLRPYELPPDAWSAVENIRMINGRAVVVDGSKQLVDTGDVAIHALDFYNGPTSQHNIIYADGAIYGIDGTGVPNSIAKPGLVFDPYPTNIWITDNLNSIPIATNNRDQPQCFYAGGAQIDPTTVSQDFPDWAPGGTYANATARIVRAYKNFIVALNLVDVNAYPNMVAWSDRADPGLMPASWDYADTTNLAGRTVLGADSGAIIAAEVLRDSLYIYCEYQTWKMDYVGGQFVMRFTKVYDNMGAFGPRCVGKFPGRHFVITKDDIVVHDGQSIPVSVGDMRVRNRVTAQLTEDDVNRVWVSPYRKFDEMWVGAPDPVTGEILYAGVWQWDDNAWSLRDLPDSRHMKELPVLEASAVDDTWDGGPDTSWDGGPNNIWNAGGEIGDLAVQVTSTDGWLWAVDSSEQPNSGLLERQDINLGGDENWEMACEVYPRMKGENEVCIRMGHADSVEGPLTWDRKQFFNPNFDNHVTVRATGRRHAIRFEGQGFELEGYDIHFKPSGKR